MMTLFKTWYTVLIASAQKYLRRLISFIMVLANSSKTLFFLSTTPFLLGICIGCIVAKTNILVCVVATNVPTCG